MADVFGTLETIDLLYDILFGSSLISLLVAVIWSFICQDEMLGRLPAFAVHEKVLARRGILWCRQVAQFFSLAIDIFIKFVLNYRYRWDYYEITVSGVSNIIDFFSLNFGGVRNLRIHRSKFVWLPPYTFAFALTILQYQQEPLPLNLIKIIIRLFILLSAFYCAFYNKEIITKIMPPDECTCGLLSYLTFSYISVPLIDLGAKKRRLDINDLPDLHDDNTCALSWAKFKKILKKYNTSNSVFTKPSKVNNINLSYCIFSLVQYDWFQQGLFQLLSSCSFFMAPLALQCILMSISYSTSSSSFASLSPFGSDGDNNTNQQSHKYALLPVSVEVALLLLILGPTLQAIGTGQNLSMGRHIGVTVKAVLTAAIYDKILKMDQSEHALSSHIDSEVSGAGSGVGVQDSCGNINNLISVDTGAIQNFIIYSHSLWSSAFEILFCIILLLNVLGTAAIGGLLVMLLAIPFGFFVSGSVNLHHPLGVYR